LIEGREERLKTSLLKRMMTGSMNEDDQDALDEAWDSLNDHNHPCHASNVGLIAASVGDTAVLMQDVEEQVIRMTKRSMKKQKTGQSTNANGP